MKTLSICAALFVVIGALTMSRAAAVAPAAAQFSAQVRLTAMKDGKRVVLAEPNVVAEEGRESSFFAGGEIPADADRNEPLRFGVTARIKVRQETPDKLRVAMYLGVGELDGHAASDFVIREQGVHCVRTVKPGETIEINLGEGRIATFSVKPISMK